MADTNSGPSAQAAPVNPSANINKAGAGSLAMHRLAPVTIELSKIKKDLLDINTSVTLEEIEVGSNEYRKFLDVLHNAPASFSFENVLTREHAGQPGIMHSMTALDYKVCEEHKPIMDSMLKYLNAGAKGAFLQTIIEYQSMREDMEAASKCYIITIGVEFNQETKYKEHLLELTQKLADKKKEFYGDKKISKLLQNMLDARKERKKIKTALSMKISEANKQGKQEQLADIKILKKQLELNEKKLKKAAYLISKTSSSSNSNLANQEKLLKEEREKLEQLLLDKEINFAKSFSAGRYEVIKLKGKLKETLDEFDAARAAFQEASSDFTAAKRMLIREMKQIRAALKSDMALIHLLAETNEDFQNQTIRDVAEGVRQCFDSIKDKSYVHSVTRVIKSQNQEIVGAE